MKVFFIGLFWVLFSAAPVVAETLPVTLNKIIKDINGVYISVVDLDNAKSVYALNETTPAKPASVMKLLTAHSALKVLGSEYRFQTRLSLQGEVGGVADSLYIIGSGDPTLTTEQLWILARAVKRRGIKQIKHLILDSSVYKTVNKRSGERAYEAGGSGLPFNFNSLTFEVCPAALGQPAFVRQDPWEYRTDIVGEIQTTTNRGNGFKITDRGTGQCGVAGRYHISGQIVRGTTCQNVYRSLACPEDYLAAVFKAFLNDLGIQVQSVSRSGVVSAKAQQFFVLYSKPLSQIVEDMNRFSNNFTAEQLVVALDTVHIKAKEREVGLNRLRGLAASLGKRSEYNIVDASGLSHNNRLSARIITRLLQEAWSDIYISTEFEKSLAVGGESGTLKLRKLKFPHAVIKAKTGSIDGVSALAGYIKGINKKYAFAILQNNGLSHSKKWEVEEKIIKVILDQVK
ncbi:MAG: D-alanyl-D-alanine carboxypeptidase/D-alanyl-D-alanine endopeptidase [Bdellovibrionota bacterium]|jgi:D-alanyl-D-alanine carboxypeptidase/D-alanyl-D-alanine-endopeptidase (penicillin-binding protein 4)